MTSWRDLAHEATRDWMESSQRHHVEMREARGQADDLCLIIVALMRRLGLRGRLTITKEEILAVRETEPWYLTGTTRDGSMTFEAKGE